MKAATAVIALALASGAAMAQAESGSVDRIAELEQQLQHVLGIVRNLSAEIATLKTERQNGRGASLDEIELTARLEQMNRQVADTNARLDDVEEIAFDIDERVGSRALLRAFDAKSFDLGGFFHAGATFVDGKENDEAAVNRLTFELLAKAELSDKWSLFVAQAFIRESNINYMDPFNRLDPNFTLVSAAPLVIATASYKHSDQFVVDMGRFITPHGIINIEHFPAILLDPEQPQFLRPFGGQTIFANFMNGVKVGGQFFEPGGLGGNLGYSAYVGSFANNADSFNYGGRVFWSFGDSGATLGANVGGGRRTGEGSGYTLYGVDFLYDKGPFQWKNEFFITDEDIGDDRLAFYSQPAWRFAKDWTAFYRFDFLDDGTLEGDKIEHAIGLTFKPVPQVHLRAIARLNRFEAAPGFPDANAENYQLSATFSF